MENIIKKHGDKFVEVQLGVLVFQEEKYFVAYCPALKLSTYGESIGDAKQAFEDLIKSYLEDGTRMGTLDRDLASHGWVFGSSMYEVTPPSEFDLDIPAGVLRKQFVEPFRVPIHAC